MSFSNTRVAIGVQTTFVTATRLASVDKPPAIPDKAVFKLSLLAGEDMSNGDAYFL